MLIPNLGIDLGWIQKLFGSIDDAITWIRSVIPGSIITILITLIGLLTVLAIYRGVGG